MKADRFVFITCVFILGWFVGAATKSPPECPTVQGQRVVSTTAKHGEYFCVYAATKGQRTRERKI